MDTIRMLFVVLKIEELMKNMLMLFTVLLVLSYASCSTDAGEWSATDVCPESNRGTFVDERDGREYKYTTIGDQVWMAENLNYEVEKFSDCLYEDDCEQHGRHYEYSIVLQGGLCPIDWHVPSLDEWRVLINTMGGEEEGGHRLKSLTEWMPLNPGEESNGTDDCGFSALPVPRSGATHFGYDAAFMTSTDKCEASECKNYSRYFYYIKMETNSYAITQSYVVAQGSERLALRCVKD